MSLSSSNRIAAQAKITFTPSETIAVGMHEYAITHAESAQPVLGSYDAFDCLIVAIYSPTKKLAMLMHIDAAVLLSSLHDTMTLFPQDGTTIAHVVGGMKDASDPVESYYRAIFTVLEEHRITIINKNIKQGESKKIGASLAIDARTGMIYTNVTPAHLMVTHEILEQQRSLQVKLTLECRANHPARKPWQTPMVCCRDNSAIVSTAAKLNATQLKEAGNHLSNSKDYAGALLKYEQAIAIDPALATAWFNKGVMLKQLRRYAEAIPALQTAISLNPGYLKAQLAKFACEQQVAARVVFASVDLKITETGEVRFLEFGIGMESGFKGLEVATGQKITDLLKEQFKRLDFLPPAVIGHIPGMEPLTLTKTRHDLPASTVPFKVEDTNTYLGMYAGKACNAYKAKQLLVVGDPILHTTFNDKCLMQDAFVATQLMRYRPNTLKFKRAFHPTLIEKILAKIHTAQVVIKAPDLEGGQGVIIVDREDVAVILPLLSLPFAADNELRMALNQYYAHFKQKWRNVYDENTIKERLRADVQRIKQWTTSRNDNFLVEEYIKGKPVLSNGNHYDPTMRVAFLWIRNHGETQCIPIACYWKLPPKPLNAFRADLRATTVSSYTKDRHEAVRVEEADQTLAYQALQASIPELFSYMARRDLIQETESLPEKSFFEKQYKLDAWLRFTLTFAKRTEYDLANYFLSKAQAMASQKLDTLLTQGTFLQWLGEHEKAISTYDGIIKSYPKSTDAYFYRGVSKRALNREEDAHLDFIKAGEINPSHAEGLMMLFLKTFSPENQFLNVVNISSQPAAAAAAPNSCSSRLFVANPSFVTETPRPNLSKSPPF